jgi:hypothetical protein
MCRAHNSKYTLNGSHLPLTLFDAPKFRIKGSVVASPRVFARKKPFAYFVPVFLSFSFGHLLSPFVPKTVGKTSEARFSLVLPSQKWLPVQVAAAMRYVNFEISQKMHQRLNLCRHS